MFNLANLFTAANLISGVIAILLAFSGRLDLAPFAIFCGLIFDFFDGFAARMLKKSGDFGKQLDSFADMITFGVAPGIIMLIILTIHPSSLENGISLVQIEKDYNLWFEALDFKTLSGNYIPFFALFIPFFSMFRLAKFNIDTRQSESFIGIPTPSMTLFFMSFPIVLTTQLNTISNVNDFNLFFFNPYIICTLILIFGLLMISEIPLFSLKVKSIGWKGNEIRIVFLLISLGLILVFKAWSFALIVFLYLILSMIENTFFKTKRNEV